MGYLVSHRLSRLCSASCTVCVCFALYNLQSHKYSFISQGRGERFRAMWSALWLRTKLLAALGCPQQITQEMQRHKVWLLWCKSEKLFFSFEMQTQWQSHCSSDCLSTPFDMAHTMQMYAREWLSKGFEKQRKREIILLFSTAVMLSNTQHVETEFNK